MAYQLKESRALFGKITEKSQKIAKTQKHEKSRLIPKNHKDHHKKHKWIFIHHQNQSSTLEREQKFNVTIYTQRQIKFSIAILKFCTDQILIPHC